MKSIAVRKPFEVDIVEVPDPVPGPYDALIKTEVSFLCNSTDRKIVEGHLAWLGPDPYPLLLGHESVGRVVAIGDKVESFSIGQRIVGGLLLDPPDRAYGSGWGGMSEYVIAKDHRSMERDGAADAAHGWDPVYKVMLPVPEDIPVEAAGLLCTWREVLSSMVADFALKPGSDIVVFGAGPVGLSFVRFARLLGFGTIVSVDPNPERLDKARAFGADEAYLRDDPRIDRLPARRGKPFDAVIDAAGREEIINRGSSLIGMGSPICVYGVIGSPSITVAVEGRPYNFGIIVHQFPTRDAEAAAQEPIVRWIRSGRLDWRGFVTSTFPVTDIRRAIEETKQKTNTKTMLVCDSWT